MTMLVVAVLVAGEDWVAQGGERGNGNPRENQNALWLHKMKCRKRRSILRTLGIRRGRGVKTPEDVEGACGTALTRYRTSWQGE